MSARVHAAALLFALAACQADPEPRSEILLVVDSDLRVPDQLDRLDIRVEGPGELAQSASAELDDGQNAPPRSLALVHEGGPLGPLHATVEGTRAGVRVVAREARFSFVAGRTLVLPMNLVSSCVGRACGDQTCTEHGCDSIDVDPATLAPYDGQEPRLDAGASDVDATADGAAPADTGVLRGPDADLADAGRAPGDAALLDGGPDAASPEAGARDACMPQAEQCNGRDDDCDGVIDDGFDLQNDSDHCGSCDVRCPSIARRCCAGSCRSACR